MKKILCCIILLSSIYAKAINIIPLPLEYEIFANDEFILDEKTKVQVIDEDLVLMAQDFAAKIKQSTGFDLIKTKRAKKVIGLYIDPEFNNPEAYHLNVSAKGIEIYGGSKAGIFYGIQSLLQMFPPEIESKSTVANIEWKIPVLAITDKPSNTYRGIHLDVCRHFTPIDSIKKMLDMMAMYKLNKFHWHLTDDQLWTPEIKQYSKLSSIGGQRIENDGSQYSGHYSQDDMREIVEYAAKRFIEVIPEIEMPGHTMAAIAAYPWLSCDNKRLPVRNVWGVEENILCISKKEVSDFMCNIIDEIVDIFPSEFVHIGCDEVPNTKWESCQSCQDSIKKYNLNGTGGLKEQFINTITFHLKSKGKKAIIWDDAFADTKKIDGTMMCWRNENYAKKALEKGNNVIMTPAEFYYFDYYQGSIYSEPAAMGLRPYLLKDMYNYNPLKIKENINNDSEILGIQGSIWVEYMPTFEHIQYMAFPRMLALAECAWSLPDLKDFDFFVERLNSNYRRLELNNINYYVPTPQGVDHKYIEFDDNITLNFNNSLNYPMFFSINSDNISTNNKYTEGIKITENTDLYIATLAPSGKWSKTVKITCRKDFNNSTSEAKPMTIKSTSGYYKSSSEYKDALFSETTIIDSLIQPSSDAYTYPSVYITEGYFFVEQTGRYEIATESEELWLNNKLIIDNNNKIKRNLTTKASILLEKGYHKYTMHVNTSAIGGFPSSWRKTEIKVKLLE